MTNADTIDEFRKSYSEGYFGIRMGGGDIYPAKLDHNRVTTANVLGLQYMVTKDGKLLSHDVNWDAEKDRILRGYPDLGCVKVGPTVGYLRVNPQRQFKKGYVSTNANLFVPNYVQIRKEFPRFVTSTAAQALVWQIFRREFWYPFAAVKHMDDGDGVGYPLSMNFGIYCHSEAENPIIFHKNHDVGVYKDKKFQLFKNYALLLEQFERETTVKAEVV